MEPRTRLRGKLGNVRSVITHFPDNCYYLFIYSLLTGYCEHIERLRVVASFTLMVTVFDGVLVFIQWSSDVFTGNLVCSCVCVLIRAVEPLLYKDRSECTLAEDKSQILQ